MLQITSTNLADVKVITPLVHGDERGYFFESYQRKKLSAALGMDIEFVQDNQSGSRAGVLRGLHYQLEHGQGKLVRVVSGEVFDVAVDIRRSSTHFRHWFGIRLSAQSHQQLWLPPGFAHGFYVLSEWAEIAYKTTTYYEPEDEHCLRYDDPDIAVQWPCTQAPELSKRDAQALPLSQAKLPV